MADKLYKRYLLFYYWDFYPSGGFNDFKCSFDTIQECKDHCEYLKIKNREQDSYNMHVFDTESQLIVCHGRCDDDVYKDGIFVFHETDITIEDFQI